MFHSAICIHGPSTKSHVECEPFGCSLDEEATNFSENEGVLVEEVFEGQQGQDLTRWGKAASFAGLHNLSCFRLGELGQLQSGSGRCIHVVVKNSFIELVEEGTDRHDLSRWWTISLGETMNYRGFQPNFPDGKLFQ